MPIVKNYIVAEEKVANCEKLYCCGRKSCENCEIFLATFSLPIK